MWPSINPGSNVAAPRSMIFAPAGTPICEDIPTCLILSPSIRTAAGASTCPLRGSSSRPALTRVTGAAAWALSCAVEAKATISSTNNVMRLRTRLKHSSEVNPKLCCRRTCMALCVRSDISRRLYYSIRSNGNEGANH